MVLRAHEEAHDVRRVAGSEDLREPASVFAVQLHNFLRERGRAAAVLQRAVVGGSAGSGKWGVDGT